MKKALLLLLVILIYSCSSDDGMDNLEKTYTLIPDEEFEKILIDKGFDSEGIVDGQILFADAKKIKTLDIGYTITYNRTIPNKRINFEGIEDFTNLTSLGLWNIATTSLDLDSNKQLIDLSLDNVEIDQFVILPNKSKLKNVFIDYSTEIKLLNFRENEELDSINISNYTLQKIDISNCKKLRSLELNISTDNFLELDISNNTNLENIKLRLDNVENIDLSTNTNLENIDLRLKKVEAIDISNLAKLTQANLISSPKLSCVKINENQDFSAFVYGYHTTFTTDCTNLPEKEYTAIPNEDLERVLILSKIDTEGLRDGKVLTKSLENAKHIAMGGRMSPIRTSLDGLETLVNLESIYFDSMKGSLIANYDFNQNPKLKTLKMRDVYNDVPTIDLDLSELKNIEKLSLLSSEFGKFDFSQCPNLKEIILGSIGDDNPQCDFTKNTNLESIEIYSHKINSIDISKSLNLKTLDLSSSSIQNINFSNNSNLEKLILRSVSSITNLDLTNNSKLNYIALYNLPLNSIDVSNKTNLETLSLAGLDNLSALDIKNNTNLKSLKVGECNLIQTIDVSSNSALEVLQIINNPQISTVNVSQNTNLKSLRILDTNVSSIDLTNNAALQILTLVNNPITNFDLSNNAALQIFRLDNVDITNLNITNQTNLKYLILNNVNNIDLDFINNNPLIEYLVLRNINNKLTTIDISHLSKLNDLNLRFNDFKSLDISNNLNLIRLNLNDNDNLECVKIAERQTQTFYYEDYFALNCN